MLSLKKKSDVPVGPLVPAWHPNFRDYEKLPDVKVVRTAFFVNAAAIVVVLALGIYFGIHEMQLRSLNAQIAATQKEIDRDKKPSDQAVALFKRFQAEQAKFEEVEKFVKSRPIVSDIILHLTQTLPEHVAIDAFDVRGNGMSLRLSVSGTPEAAAGYATAYLEQLTADKELTAFDRTKFQFTNQARNPTTGGVVVEFFLGFVPGYVEKSQ